jgi:hypothetical protein
VIIIERAIRVIKNENKSSLIIAAPLTPIVVAPIAAKMKPNSETCPKLIPIFTPVFEPYPAKELS